MRTTGLVAYYIIYGILSFLISLYGLVRMQDMQKYIERERDQLLTWWRKSVHKDGCWAKQEYPRLLRVNELPETQISPILRSFHDKLGFMAKLNVTQGGLCAGAIFRTESFILQENRSGKKLDGNIHIEHTVPINVLSKQIVRLRPFKYDELVNWLLTCSVSTAMRKGQQDLFTNYSKDTFCFENGHEWFNKPFMRYRNLFKHERVWNVFTRKVVDEHFTFEKHKNIISDLIDEVDGPAYLKSVLSNR